MVEYCEYCRIHPVRQHRSYLIFRYAGGSDGIYEYHVNVAGRKVFPNLVFR